MHGLLNRTYSYAVIMANKLVIGYCRPPIKVKMPHRPTLPRHMASSIARIAMQLDGKQGGHLLLQATQRHEDAPPAHVASMYGLLNRTYSYVVKWQRKWQAVTAGHPKRWGCPTGPRCLDAWPPQSHVWRCGYSGKQSDNWSLQATQRGEDAPPAHVASTHGLLNRTYCYVVIVADKVVICFCRPPIKVRMPHPPTLPRCMASSIARIAMWLKWQTK